LTNSGTINKTPASLTPGDIDCKHILITTPVNSYSDQNNYPNISPNLLLLIKLYQTFAKQKGLFGKII